MSTMNTFFWALVLYPIFLAIGPWSIGYLVENHIGVVFAWGIFVNGAYLPGSFTYAYGFIQVFNKMPLNITELLTSHFSFWFSAFHLSDTTNFHSSKCCSLQVINFYLIWPDCKLVVFFRFKELILKPGKPLPLRSKICLHLPFSVIFTMQVMMAYIFWLAYGTLAFILGPLRTWSLILAAVLYYWAMYLDEKSVRYNYFTCFSKLPKIHIVLSITSKLIL